MNDINLNFRRKETDANATTESLRFRGLVFRVLGLRARGLGFLESCRQLCLGLGPTTGGQFPSMGSLYEW